MQVLILRELCVHFLRALRGFGCLNRCIVTFVYKIFTTELTKKQPTEETQREQPSNGAEGFLLYCWWLTLANNLNASINSPCTLCAFSPGSPWFRLFNWCIVTFVYKIFTTELTKKQPTEETQRKQPTNGINFNKYKRRKIINTLRLLFVLLFPVYQNYELIIFISQTGRYAIGLPLQCRL
jgi:hypothetical protein